MFKGKRTAPCARMAANRRRAVSGAVAEALESRRLLSLTVYIPTGGWAYVGWEQENPQDAANINVSLVNGTLTVNGVVHGTDIIGGEIEGTPCDDTITISGSGAGNPQWHIYGLAGDDTITGSGYSAGSLTMWGSDGDDLLVGGSKGDTLFGGYGDDTLIGNCGDDVLVGGPGNDVIDGGCGNDSVHGNEGNDTIRGGEGDDDLEGDEGDDNIDGGEGIDRVNGGEGDDTIKGGGGGGSGGIDTVIGGPGNDEIDGVEDGDDLPNADNDFVSAASSHHRVDIHGVPLPDASPTGDGESDRIPNSAHIDAFSLAPSFSTTDIAVPMPGGELTLEFRRTLGIDSETTGSSGFRWPSETILGPCWNTNLATRVTVTEDVSAFRQNRATTKATVYDDTGGASNYFLTNQGFFPDVLDTFSNASLRGRLQLIDSSTLVYEARFKTRLYFTKVTFVDRIVAGQSATREWYYRLEKIVDRNDNELRYEYCTDKPTLVKRIFDPNVQDRQIVFEYQDIFGSWRLTSATDPLGRVYRYTINTDTGWLKSVTKPLVRDPASPDSAPTYFYPRVDFDYTQVEGERIIEKSNGDAPWDSQTLIRWTMPIKIQDARRTATEGGLNPEGNETTFHYTFRSAPTGFQKINDAVVAMWEPKPRLDQITTTDGTVLINEIARDFGGATTQIIDTSGTAWRYTFGSRTGDQFIQAPNDLGFAIVTDQVKREVDITNVDGTTTHHTVTYTYSRDINGNLLEARNVEEPSGGGPAITDNTVKFEYRSWEPGDLFDQFTIFGEAYGTYYAVYGQPSKSILAFGEVDVHTQYRYDLLFNKEIKRIDAEGKVTRYVLDDDGNRTDVFEADGSPVAGHTHYDFDPNGFLRRLTDPDGRVTEYIPNAFGNVRYTIVKGLPGEDLTFETQTSYPGIETDGVSRWLVSERFADVMDRTNNSFDGHHEVTHYDYDNWDRVIQITLPAVLGPNGYLATVAKTLYDYNSNVVRETDHNGHVTITEYDNFNRPVLVRRRMGSNPNANDTNDIVTRQDYDPRGLLEWEEDGNGYRTTHQYDAMLRQIRSSTEHYDPPAAGAQPVYSDAYVTKFYYGPNSGSGAFTLGGFNPTRVINPRGFATDTVYDSAYRAVKTIRRYDDGFELAHNAEPRSNPTLGNEPTTITTYNKVHKPIQVTVLNETRSGYAENRNTYTFYDDRHRPTVTVVDLYGDGPGPDVTPEQFFNDAADFVGDEYDFITRTSYDSAGNVRFVTDAEGRTTETVYDGASRVTSVKSPGVLIFSPGTGQVTFHVPTTVTQYDADSNAVVVTDANGTGTLTDYDARGRVFRTILDLDDDGFDTSVGPNSSDIVKQTGYDYAGNAIYSIDPNGNRTDTRYDNANRAYEVEGPAVWDVETGSSRRPLTATQYDKNGNVIRVTDPRGIVTATDYDSLNRARFVTANANAAEGAADQLVTESRYDAGGNVTALVLHNWVNEQHRPQETTYEYDPYDRRTKEILPHIDGYPRQTTTVYNRAGEAITVTDPKLQDIETDYDRAGRVLGRRFIRFNGSLEQSTDRQYDRVGNLLSESDAFGTSTYTYDGLNRITSESRVTDGIGHYDVYTVEFAYDAVGNRTRVIYPETGRTLVSHFDRAGRLTDLYDGHMSGDTFVPVLSPSMFSYDSAGNRLSHTSPYGVVTSASFDALNRVESLTSRGGWGAGAVLYSISYEYDLAGNRRHADETIDGVGWRGITWIYDDLYRLIYEAWDGDAATQPQERFYTYDPAGNRLSRSVTIGGGDAVTTTYEYDDRNRLLSSTTGEITTTYEHDANGNRTSKSVENEANAVHYIYDVANRLIRVTVNNSDIFKAYYDARSRRIGKIENDGRVTIYRYDGGTSFQEWRDLDGEGTPEVVLELIRAGGLGGGIGSILYTNQLGPEGIQLAWEGFLYNAVGHTVMVVNSSGVPTQRNVYEAFGERVYTSGNSVNNRLRNTKERDNSIGLDNDGFRYYDPETGRYIQRDPIGYKDGLNVYHSVHNNPINAIDPLGLATVPTYVQGKGVRVADNWFAAKAYEITKLTPTTQYPDGYYISAPPTPPAGYSGSAGMAGPAAYLGQGGLNVLQGAQNLAISAVNDVIANTKPAQIANLAGVTTDIPSPDWSKDALASEHGGHNLSVGLAEAGIDSLAAAFFGKVGNPARSEAQAAAEGFVALEDVTVEGQGQLQRLSGIIKDAGDHFMTRIKRTIAVGRDGSGTLHAGSSSGRWDKGMAAAAENLGIKKVPAQPGQHAEETLMNGVQDLRTIGTSRPPCGTGGRRHDCAGQLAERGVKVDNR